MNRQDCKRFALIGMQEACGELAHIEEREFRQRHLEECEECRLEARLEATLRVVDGDDDHFPADEPTRRRTIDQALAPARRPVPRETKARNVIRWLWPVPVPAALAAGLLLLAGGAVLVSQSRGWMQWGAPERDVPLVVALTAGGPAVPERNLDVGYCVAKGESLDTGTRDMGLRVDARIKLLLAPETRIRLVRSTSKVIQVALAHGAVHGMVDPSRPGPALVVSTPAGDVRVTGTFFSVSASQAGAEVSVLHGRVEVTEQGQAPRPVSGAQTSRLGSHQTNPWPADQQSAAKQAAERLDLLTGGAGARIDVRSSPPGLAVSFNGRLAGKTPVSGVLLPGRYQMTVARGIEIVAQEWVDLAEGAVLTRNYTKPLVPETVKTPAPTRVGPTSPVGHVLRPHVEHEVRPAVDELLAMAVRYRTEQNWQAAVDAYQQLLHLYPTSAGAKAARVSIGMLLLAHLGHPQAALRSCEAYLDENPHGELAEEANVCRIDALHAQERRDDERAAIQTFLAVYPRSVQTARLRARLDELGKGR
jgi:hypothetical protein